MDSVYGWGVCGQCLWMGCLWIVFMDGVVVDSVYGWGVCG